MILEAVNRVEECLGEGESEESSFIKTCISCLLKFTRIVKVTLQQLWNKYKRKTLWSLVPVRWGGKTTQQLLKNINWLLYIRTSLSQNVLAAYTEEKATILIKILTFIKRELNEKVVMSYHVYSLPCLAYRQTGMNETTRNFSFTFSAFHKLKNNIFISNLLLFSFTHRLYIICFNFRLDLCANNLLILRGIEIPVGGHSSYHLNHSKVSLHTYVHTH